MITKQVQNTIITKQVEAGFLECNNAAISPKFMQIWPMACEEHKPLAQLQAGVVLMLSSWFWESSIVCEVSGGI